MIKFRFRLIVQKMRKYGPQIITRKFVEITIIPNGYNFMKLFAKIRSISNRKILHKRGPQINHAIKLEMMAIRLIN